jgi:hypothetical protein
MRRLPARPLAIALVIAAAAVAAPARAEAPPVTEDGAKALAAALKDGLARWFPKTEDSVDLRWKGEPVAIPAGDHYEVTLPPVSAVEEDGTSIEVGSVRLTVKPQDGGTHAITATLPDAIPVLDSGKPSATIRIGRQRFSGVWSGAYETLLSVDADYGDLSVTSDKKPGKDGKKDESALTVGSVTMTGDLKPDDTATGTSTWSGPGALSISNVRFLDEHKKEVMSLAGLTAEGSYTRVDLSRAAAMQRLTQTHALAGTEPTAAEVVPLMQGLMAGASFRMHLSALKGENPEDGTRLELAQFSTRSSVEDLDKPLAGATLGFEASGLSLTPPVAPKAFMPDKLDVQISAAKLPTATLWKSFSDLATLAESQAQDEEEEDGEDTPDPQAEAIMNRLVGAMAEVGSEMRIDTLVVNTPATSGTVTGSMRMAANSAYGAVGGATVLLRGLDAAAKALQPKPGQKADKEMQSTLGIIAMLQAMGQASKDEAGNDVRSYKIDLTETGQMLLNGADMAPLLGGAGAEPEAEPEPAPKKGSKKL